MSENPRDTQFKGFAKALMHEMVALNGYGCIDISGHWTDEDIQEYVDAIARRAYDLVVHTIYSVPPLAYECREDDEIVASIPDFTAWAEEASK